jgi:hypothetical protein
MEKLQSIDQNIRKEFAALKISVKPQTKVTRGYNSGYPSFVFWYELAEESKAGEHNASFAGAAAFCSMRAIRMLFREISDTRLILVDEVVHSPGQAGIHILDLNEHKILAMPSGKEEVVLSESG